jgi:hypothetical protein
LVNHRVTPALALSSPLTALLNVTLDGGSLTEAVTIEAVAAGDPAVVRAAISLGAPTHIVRGRGVYELDQTYGVQMLGALLGIVAEDIAGYDLTAAEVDAFGFDRPTMRVEFDLRNGTDVPVEHYSLAVLRKDDGWYMTRNGNGVIYAVAEPAFTRLEYGKLAVRWFLSPLLVDVSAIEIATPERVHTFALSGETSAALSVTCDDTPYDIERFRTLYGLISSAAHDGGLLGDLDPEGEPLLRITYRYRDPEKAPDEMALYPGDARRLVVSVNGVTEMAMREAYLTRVLEALDNLWTDVPLETAW